MAELLARISSRELTEWMIYYNQEPFGEIQQEYRAGLVASIIAETARDQKKRKEPFRADEFMRKSYLDLNGQESEENDPDKVLFTKAQAIFGALGAKKKD